MATVSRNTQILPSLSPPAKGGLHERAATYTLSVLPIAMSSLNTESMQHCRSPSIPQSLTADTDEDNDTPNAHEQDIDIYPLSPMQHLSDTNHLQSTLISPVYRDKTPNQDADDDVFDRILFSFSRQESSTRDKRRSISYSRKCSKAGARRSHHKLPILGPNIDDILNNNPTRPRRGTSQLIVPSPSRSSSVFHSLGQKNDTETYRQRWTDSPSTSGNLDHSKTNDSTSNSGTPQFELVGPPLHLNIKTYSEPIRPQTKSIEDNVARNVETTIRVLAQEPAMNGRRTTIRPIGSKPNITRYVSADLDNIKTSLNTYIDHEHRYIDSDSDDEDGLIMFDDDIMSVDDDKKTVDPLQSELVFESTAESLVVSCGNSKVVFEILRKICVDLKKDESLPYIISFEDEILQYEHVEAFLKLLGFIKNTQNKQWICDAQSRVETRLIDCAILECQKCLLLIRRHASIKDLIQNHRQSSSSYTKPSSYSKNKHKSVFSVPSLTVIPSEQSASYGSSTSLHEEDEKADSLQLYELIWSITHIKNEDHIARDVLLLCYPLVTTEKHMMQCLEQRFFNDDECMNGSETKYDRILSSFHVQAKVIGFIRRWMQGYWNKDWKDNTSLISLCKSFTQRTRKICDEKGSRLIELLNKTMLNQKGRHKTILNKRMNNGIKRKTKKKKKRHKKSHSFLSMSLGSNSYSKLPGIGDLININHITIAEQITLRQFAIFKSIHHRECLKQSWKDPHNKHILAPNIIKYIDAFNHLTKWIQSSILMAHNLRDRGKTIKKWVKVEQALYKLRNFQALCAVFSALASSAIYKLKSAWNYVAKKHMTQHDMIDVIMRSNANWKNLRRLELETHPPMIPYFGMFAQDLIVIEETTSNLSNDGSINWDALWRVNAVIDKYLIYQNTSYHHLSFDDDIQQWMNKEMNMCSKLDDDWAFQVSQHVCDKDKEELNKNSHRLLFKSK